MALRDCAVEFYAADVTRILGIKRTRLEQWLERGYVTPSLRHAQGPGTRNVYSLSDIYGLAILQGLLQMGILRESASKLAQANWEAVKNKDKQYGVVRVKLLSGWTGRRMVLREMDTSKEAPKIDLVKEGEDAVLVINLKQVFDEVDDKL
jgi:DNA-binding transcriptional MerR regulator